MPAVLQTTCTHDIIFATTCSDVLQIAANVLIVLNIYVLKILE